MDTLSAHHADCVVLFQSHAATGEDESSHTEVVWQLYDSAAESQAGNSCRSRMALGNTPTALQGLEKTQLFPRSTSGLGGQGRVLTQAESRHP